MLTNFAINHAGAIEVNGVAGAAIEHAGFAGLIALKVATMLVVIGVCEALVSRRPALGARIAEWAVAVSAFPVALTLAQLVGHAARLGA